MTWSRLEPLTEPARSGCLHCPSKPVRLQLNRDMHPGFGIVSVVRDGETVVSDVHGTSDSNTLEAERLAAADPDHDWRFQVDAPMWSGTWQRQGDRTWLLVDKGMGFA